MFFTTAGRIVAWLAIIFGGVRVAMAVHVGQMGDPSLIPRYLGGGTIGDSINLGMYEILFGIVVGVLTDISRSVRKKPEIIEKPVSET